MKNAERRIIVDKFLMTHQELSSIKYIPEAKRTLQLLEMFLSNRSLDHHEQMLHLFRNTADFLAHLEVTLPIELGSDIPRVQQIQTAIQDAVTSFREHDNMARYGEAHGLTYQQRLEARESAEQIKRSFPFRVHSSIATIEDFLGVIKAEEV